MNKDNEDKKREEKLLKKKRKRKTIKGTCNVVIKRCKKPRLMDKDNICKKIQAHYINKFLINFLNLMIENEFKGFKGIENINDFKLKKIKQKSICSVKKVNLIELKNKTIKELLNYDISPLYKNFKNNTNKVLSDIYINSKFLKNLFNKSYLFFFPIYCDENRQINCNHHGLFEIKDTIKLSQEVQLFNDLVNKIKGKNYSFEDEYIKKIIECKDEYKNRFKTEIIKS